MKRPRVEKMKRIKIDFSFSLPNPFLSNAELTRFENSDLQDFTDLELWRERKQIEMVIAHGDLEGCFLLTPNCELVFAEKWLEDRLRAIEGEKKNRARGGADGKSCSNS